MSKNYKGDITGQKKRRRRRVAARQAVLLAEIKRDGCIECGERHPGCLDFHHRDPSTKWKRGAGSGMADLVGKGRSWSRVLAEIAKCDLLCSNCHRKHHWEERLALARHKAVQLEIVAPGASLEATGHA